MKKWLIRIAVLSGILAATWWGYQSIKAYQQRRALEQELGRAGPAAFQTAERRQAALLTKGPYASDPDPVVNFRLKAGWDTTFVAAKAHTDAFGMRRRSGPKPDPKAQRLIILGDSVAFGYGVEDQDVIAHQLELVLGNACLPNQPSPVVFTVACPSWNFRNAFRYLRNHAFRLKPDVVLWIPVANDLDDGYQITESGHCGSGIDLSLGSHRLPIRISGFLKFAQLVGDRLSKERISELSKVGLRAITEAHRNGITPLSRLRFDQLVSGLADLNRDLKQNNARFSICYYWNNSFDQDLEYRLLKRDPEFPSIHLFERQDLADTLVTDGHPNAASHRAAAITIAHDLVAKGWVNGIDPKQLPEIPAAFASRRMTKRSARERETMESTAKDLMKAWMGSFIDLSMGEGLHQIYAGVEPDGRVGRMCSLSLSKPKAATHLELDLRLIPQSSFLYPCTLQATFNGVPSPPIELPQPHDELPEISLRFPIPMACADDAILDVDIVPSNYVEQWIDKKQQENLRLTSFFLRAVRLR